MSHVSKKKEVLMSQNYFLKNISNLLLNSYVVYVLTFKNSKTSIY